MKRNRHERAMLGNGSNAARSKVLIAVSSQKRCFIKNENEEIQKGRKLLLS